MACNEQKEKQDLLRIVKSKDGQIQSDLTGKKNGRGAYICCSEECLDKAIKSKRIDKEFETELNDEIYALLRRDINKDE